MTNYSKIIEKNRNDEDLKYAIFMDLSKDYAAYAESATYLQRIYDNAVLNRSEVYSLLMKSIWYRDFLYRVLEGYPENDTYISNQAAFMSEDEVKAIKEKYAENLTNK